MRPEPSKYYKPAEDACPYHLIIGIDRRVAKPLNQAKTRTVDPLDYAGINELAEMFQCNKIILRWLLNEYKVSNQEIDKVISFNKAEAKKIFDEHYPPEDYVHASNIEIMGIMSTTLTARLVKEGRLAPVMVISGNNLFSVKECTAAKKDYLARKKAEDELQRGLLKEASAQRKREYEERKAAGEGGGESQS